MKKVFSAIFLCVMLVAFSACGASNQETPATSTSTPSSESEQSVPAESSGTSVAAENQEEMEGAKRRISVQFGENIVIYELNDSAAATSLYEQLPLTIEVENYSTNEKIFYPPEPLNTSDAPLAQAGNDTLAYYAPWGDVVMFYSDYTPNPSLYELGQVVSGGELVSEMTGLIVIDSAE